MKSIVRFVLYQVFVVLIGITICVFNNYERIQQWIEPPADHHLNYNDFSEFCNKADGIKSQETTVLADIDCSQLIGLHVQWDGHIKASKVISVYNPVLAVLSFFPKVSSTEKVIPEKKT